MRDEAASRCGRRRRSPTALAVAFPAPRTRGSPRTWPPGPLTGQSHMLVNPWGLWWRDTHSRSVVDEDARVISSWTSRPHAHPYQKWHARASVIPPPVRLCWPRWAHCRIWCPDRRAVPRRPVPGRGIRTVDQHAPAHSATIGNTNEILAARPPDAQPLPRPCTGRRFESSCKLAYDVMLTNQKPVEMKQSRTCRVNIWAGAARIDHQGPNILSS